MKFSAANTTYMHVLRALMFLSESTNDQINVTQQQKPQFTYIALASHKELPENRMSFFPLFLYCKPLITYHMTIEILIKPKVERGQRETECLILLIQERSPSLVTI